MIQKGLVSSVSADGKTATVVYDGNVVTPPLVVPFFLAGALNVKTAVCFAVFPDNSGIIFSRMDGEWSREIGTNLKISGSLELVGGLSAQSADIIGGLSAGTADVTGTLTASDVETASVPSVNGHKHTYERGGTGTGTTSTPT